MRDTKWCMMTELNDIETTRKALLQADETSVRSTPSPCMFCKINPRRDESSDYCQTCWDNRLCEKCGVNKAGFPGKQKSQLCKGCDAHKPRNGDDGFLRSMQAEPKALAPAKTNGHAEPCTGCHKEPRKPDSAFCVGCYRRITPQAKLADARKYKKCDAITPEEQAEIEKVAFGMGVQPTTEADEPEEGGLKYPQLRFPYEAIPEGRLKRLVEQACEGGIDPGLVVPALLTLIGSIPSQDKMCGQRINLFTTLLTMVGAGKDTAIDRSIDVLGLRESEGRIWSNYAPSGERSISQHLGDKPGTKENPTRTPGPWRRCIVTYELEETLDKSKGETSSVLRAMQHYWDHNRKVYEDAKFRNTQTVDCRVSWLSGLPVGDGEIDETAFRLAFGERSMHGTGSRMIFGFAERRVDLRATCDWEPEASLYEFGETREEQLDFGPVTIDRRTTLANMLHDSKVIGWAPGVREQYLAWQPKKDLSGRDLHHAGKIAVVCALAQGHELVEQSDWDFAVAFMDWQHEIRLVFASGRAKTITLGEFKELIMKEMEKRTKNLIHEQKNTKHAAIAIVDGKERYYIRWKGAANDGKWFRFGWSTEKAIESLVADGHLAYKLERKLSDDGKTDRWVDDEAWVEWIG